MQVEFDEGKALALCDRNGMITKENFYDFAVKTNLVDWSTISDKVNLTFHKGQKSVKNLLHSHS